MKWGEALVRCTIGGLLLLVLASGAAVGKTLLNLESSIAVLPLGLSLDLDSSFVTFQAGHYTGDVASLPNRFLRMLFLTDGTLTNKGFGTQTIIRFPMHAADRGGSVEFSIYSKSDLVIDWPVGTWSVISNVAFSTFTSDLSRWWSTINISAYGTSTTLTFALVPTQTGPATGFSIDITAPTLGGMGVAIGAGFGMPTAFDDIGTFTPTASCDLVFREATVGFEGFLLGCLALDIETTIGCQGFKSTEITFDLDLWTDVLDVEGGIEFAIQTKSVTLIPRLRLDQECIWVNIGIDPEIWGEIAAIDTLIVRGAGITSEAIDASKFSSIASFIGGVYREVLKGDIELRAGDYYVALDPEADTSQYVFLPYDLILSLEHSEANSDLAFDVYFGSPESNLFDLAFVTAEWVHRLSAQLELYVGALLDPNGVDMKFVFGFEASAFLP
ncbi:MAG TPA: hypothetical protein VMX15_00230 [Candidatus Heimdallarchaeota archaeon]|nr:hypothetical protein [Candidatus Heimdallarchaeota archaeon]